MDFRRKIEKECFNCHNAYAASASEANSPDLFLPGNIPEGIDCQRCHGPGAQHVRNPRAGIVNPARLSSERQLEICFQCHLKSTTLRLPSTIRRFDRGYFYRPGEPLEDYVLHFDRGPGSGDKFEIAHSAYRLLKSTCFVKSKGALVCTSCHSPHGVQPDYARVCLDCHRTGLPASHVQSRDCVTCHMPQRRTDDVVHAIMTDHYIQRNKPARDLLAPLTEVHETEKTAYKGEVVLLYPPTASNALYLAVAQVAEGANLKAGLLRLQAAIDTYRPREAEFYFYLADGYRQNGQKDRAIRYYQEALSRKPDFLAARLNSAALLNKSDAAQSLEIAARIAPRDPAILNKLAEAYLDLGKTEQAVTNLQRAVTLDPDFAEAYENLANILQAAGDFHQAESHFKTSIALDPESVAAHFNYGRVLAARACSIGARPSSKPR
jgi:Flp pilus assembly protein TadD